MNKVWEYEVDVVREYDNHIGKKSERSLMNDRGKNGWELVSVLVNPAWAQVVGVFYYWKKELKPHLRKKYNERA